jgi:hypothetical protein
MSYDIVTINESAGMPFLSFVRIADILQSASVTIIEAEKSFEKFAEAATDKFDELAEIMKTAPEIGVLHTHQPRRLNQRQKRKLKRQQPHG